MAPTGSDLFAREAYTTEVYPTREDMIEGGARLRATFAQQQIGYRVNHSMSFGHA